MAGSMLKLYPNPGTGKFTIEIAGLKGNAVVLFDLTGKLTHAVPVEAEGDDRYRFDISDQPEGIYMVKAQTQFGVKIIRVLKVH